MPRILHVLSQLPDRTGSGIFVQAMIRRGVAAGHDVHLVAALPGGTADCPVEIPGGMTAVRFEGRDLLHTIVGMSDVMPYPSLRFRDMTPDQLTTYEQAFAERIRTAISTFSPDLIHSNHLWLVSSLIKRTWPHIPMVTTCHGSDLRQFASCPHLRERVLSGCRQIEAVLALSRAQELEIEEQYDLPADRIHVIGAGMETALFACDEKPPAEVVRFAYAGKLSRAKGVPWMLRALQDCPGAWHLDLMGDGSGPEKEECLDLARALGQRIRIHGHVTQSALAGIMARAHVFVLPSFFEGLPLVLLEALSAGCRLVATDLPGVSEVLGNLDEELLERVALPRLECVDVPVCADEAAFTARLTRAMTRHMERTRENACPRTEDVREVLQRFSWEAVFTRVSAVYARLLPSAG